MKSPLRLPQGWQAGLREQTASRAENNGVGKAEKREGRGRRKGEEEERETKTKARGR